jgi:Glycosyl hydrolase family 10
MGAMSFRLPANLSAESLRELERASVGGGPDNMPWPTRVRIEPGLLTVYREVDESGYLAVPWEIKGIGKVMASTATLMERPEPYDCQVELARGKVNQVRSQASDWQTGGLVLPEGLERDIQQASHLFGHAATAATPPGENQDAQSALELAYQAAQKLARLYQDQVFRARQARESGLPASFGFRVASLDSPVASALAPACNSICLPLSWSSVERVEGEYRWEQADTVLAWAEQLGVAVTGGPVIDFSSAQMPDWLWLYERDPASINKFMSNYLMNVLRRYHRRIRRWQLTTASNSASVLSLSEEELLWLTIRLVQVARQLDSGLELVVGLVQPWGEYLTTEDHGHSPFIFADTLVRSELRLAALDIEIIMGLSGRGSYCRDVLETSRLLDLYALLGVPLRVTLGFPSNDAFDAKADPEMRVHAGRWRDGFSASFQAEWAEAFASLALCKPYIEAVHWVQVSDQGPHQFPHCGLFGPSGQPKPALDRMRQIRQRRLG